jgi:anthranilate synthase/aminodeoxychorismate synthase-like glutamine amidotransferase
MILLVDNYDSFTYNLYQYLAELGARVRVRRNDSFSMTDVERWKPSRIVLSPGPGRPDGAGACLEVVRRFAGRIPILGVCLGHQTIGQAFGGKVVRAKRLMHGKTSPIRHDGRGVFRGLPAPFEATRYHSLVVEPGSLPRSLRVSARAGDGAIMGLRHRRWRVEGVQFHPESFRTEGGKRLLKNFIGGRR